MLLIRRRKKNEYIIIILISKTILLKNNQFNTNPSNISKSKANNFKLRKASVVAINTAYRYYERFML